MKRKIALVVGSTFLCASILSGCASATPVDKYLRSFDKGDSEAASQIYSEEIKDNAEDKEALQTKLKERMDSIYENFKSGKITSDEAKEKLKSYKEYDTSSVYAFTTINKVTTLQKSRDAYSDAEKAENDGNLADAITNYKSVIEDDPNHETAQAKVLQLSETYTETMKAQAQQEADSKDYDRAINTINKLSDVVGNTDELKTLAQEYSELKNYRYIKVVCTNKENLPEDSSAWRFSDYVLFTYELTNNSDKAIKGVQGVLHIKDLFGDSIMDSGCDFTGYTIQPGETHVDDELSLEINPYIDYMTKVYNTNYSDLIFEYGSKTVVSGNSVYAVYQFKLNRLCVQFRKTVFSQIWHNIGSNCSYIPFIGLDFDSITSHVLHPLIYILSKRLIGAYSL